MELVQLLKNNMGKTKNGILLMEKPDRIYHSFGTSTERDHKLLKLDELFGVDL